MAINVINLNNGKKKKKLKINDYIWAMQINSTQCEINETNKPKKKSSPSLLRLSSGFCDYYFFFGNSYCSIAQKSKVVTSAF